MGWLPCVSGLAPIGGLITFVSLLGSLGMLRLLLVGRLLAVSILIVVGLLPCAASQFMRAGADTLPELPPVQVPTSVDQGPRGFRHGRSWWIAALELPTSRFRHAGAELLAAESGAALDDATGRFRRILAVVRASEISSDTGDTLPELVHRLRAAPEVRAGRSRRPRGQASDQEDPRDAQAQPLHMIHLHSSRIGDVPPSAHDSVNARASTRGMGIVPASSVPIHDDGMTGTHSEQQEEVAAEIARLRAQGLSDDEIIALKAAEQGIEPDQLRREADELLARFN
jgi:hypothetical protein